LAVEGYHDQAAIGRILKESGLKRFDGTYDDKFDLFWKGFIPVYPKKGGNLYTRVAMPSIFTSQTHSVAIYVGEGNNLVSGIVKTLSNHQRYAKDIQAFGLIVDADKKQPKEVAKEKAEGLKSIFPMISSEPGTITAGPPRTGIYVLPNNEESGVLDSVLTDCASIVYPDHKEAAENFLNSLDKDHTKHFRPFDKEKALIACIVSVLKPGKSNTPSITDDKWISHQTIDAVNNIRLLYEFLKVLLDLN
jgi:hypothetical protein